MRKDYTLYSLRPIPNGGKRIDEERHIFYCVDSLAAFEDEVIMSIKDYPLVFQTYRNWASKSKKRLSVVKITYEDKTGTKRSIYRKFRPCYDDNFQGCVAVTTHSFLFLKVDDNLVQGEKVTVRKSTAWRFYCNHPNEIVHMTFRLGILSFGLALVSLIITVLFYSM